MESKRTWRPNQSGTFSNRVSFHDPNENKLFVLEHYSEDIKYRGDITKIVFNAPEMKSAIEYALNKIYILENTDKGIRKDLKIDLLKMKHELMRSIGIPTNSTDQLTQSRIMKATEGLNLEEK